MTYNKIKDSLYMAGSKDYSMLKIKCYLCDKKKDHISIDCPSFRQISGNLKRHYKKIRVSDNKKAKKKRLDNKLEH